MRNSPPFRAEHIGSLLRPRALLEARDKHAKGGLSAQALAMAEDQAIREAIALQERVGFKLVTDGEFRRSSYHSFFFASWETSPLTPLRGRFRRQGRATGCGDQKQAALEQTHPCRRFRLPQTALHFPAEDHDSRPLRAAFPRRGCRGKSARLQRRRRILGRRRAGVSRRIAGWRAIASPRPPIKRRRGFSRSLCDVRNRVVGMLVQRYRLRTFRRDIRRPSRWYELFGRRPKVEVFEYSPHDCRIVN